MALERLFAGSMVTAGEQQPPSRDNECRKGKDEGEGRTWVVCRAGPFLNVQRRSQCE